MFNEIEAIIVLLGYVFFTIIAVPISYYLFRLV